MAATNLQDICGLDPTDCMADRVVSFELSDDQAKMLVTECCDRWAWVELSAEQVDQLIDFLQQQRERMS